MATEAPVALFVFNRPNQTKEVFDRIRLIKPSSLLIVADGPRPTRVEENDLCRKVRGICTSGIDWPCDVKTNFSDVNLGCKQRMSTGLDWVFDTVESAIILEDDCLPGVSYFGYCNELLLKYRDDERVMQICGTNVDETASKGEFSYYFSKYGPVWGWASWRRAWKHYDVNMRSLNRMVKDKILDNIWEYPGEGEYRLELYNRILSGELDTWDLQWGYAKYINSGLSIIPATNLISNIGYGGESTHTGDANDPMADRPIKELTFPLHHFPFVIRNRAIDRAFHEKMTPEKYKNTERKLE